MIHRTRLKTIQKIAQVEKLEKKNPKLKPLKKVHLDYLKPMEPYELRVRDIVKTRIKKLYMVMYFNLKIFRKIKKSLI